MTALAKLEANEKRDDLFARDGYTCQHCGLSIYRHGTPQLAHRIAKSKANLSRYGESVIHHPRALASVCSLYCNSRMNIGNDPGKVAALVDEIRDEMLGE
jgi:5-methylcytosine-specific restriction endonuclease McrA